MARVTQEHVDARRRQIIDAAKRMFGRKGLEPGAASISDIAAEAGLSAGSIYSYFENKDELIAVIQSEAMESDRRLFEELDRSRSPTDNVWGVVDWMWDGLTRDEYRDGNMLTVERWLLQARRGGDEGREPTELVVGLLADLIGDAQAEGGVTAEVAARELANTVFFCMQGARAQYLRTGDADGVLSALATLKRLLATTTS